MKKIFLSAFALLLIVAANAQNERSAPVPKTSTEPLVNGIPYSKYKAEQDALKQQATAKSASSDVITITPADVKKAATSQPVIDITRTADSNTEGAIAPVEKAKTVTKQENGDRNGYIKPAPDASKVKVQPTVKEEAVSTTNVPMPTAVKVEIAPVKVEPQKVEKKVESTEPSANGKKVVKSEQ